MDARVGECDRPIEKIELVDQLTEQCDHPKQGQHDVHDRFNGVG